ncbi:MAG TPA: hypothetical protein VIV06_04695 [Candidatus Limnocylindrales bacterium]
MPTPGPLSRRRLIVLAGLLPVGAAAAATAATIATRGARLLRPDAVGSTAAVCATCGATDHAMLDPRCPAAPKISPANPRQARG